MNRTQRFKWRHITLTPKLKIISLTRAPFWAISRQDRVHMNEKPSISACGSVSQKTVYSGCQILFKIYSVEIESSYHCGHKDFTRFCGTTKLWLPVPSVSRKCQQTGQDAILPQKNHHHRIRRPLKPLKTLNSCKIIDLPKLPFSNQRIACITQSSLASFRNISSVRFY